MKIIHIAPWCSCRVFKEVLCQQKNGMDVTLLAHSTGHPELHAAVQNKMGWSDPSVIATLQHDVFVLHTTIATERYAENIISAIPKGRKVILDCHDYTDFTKTIEPMVDHVVVPSKGYSKYFTKPTTVIYSKVPMSIYDLPVKQDTRKFCMCSRRNGIVLLGTINSEVPYLDYRQLDEELRKDFPEDHLYVYPSEENPRGHEHLRLMRRLPYPELLRAIAFYKYGYAGSANPAVDIFDCVTNKFWEYKAAGIKNIITTRAAEMSALQEELNGASAMEFFMESDLDKMREAYAI